MIGVHFDTLVLKTWGALKKQAVNQNTAKKVPVGVQKQESACGGTKMGGMHDSAFIQSA